MARSDLDNRRSGIAVGVLVFLLLENQRFKGSKVPKWFNTMSQLQVIDMGYNQIRELPSFSKLVNLHTVDFQSNNLSEFPFEWYDLPSLNRIFLFDNPWKLTSKEYDRMLKMKDLMKLKGGELFVN